MKLATLKNRTADGRLVVLSNDLTMCSEVGHITATLQAGLDDWQHVGPRLERVASGLERGSQPTSRFHEHDAMAPLPRAYRRIDARSGLEIPAGKFDGPRDRIETPTESVSARAGYAVILDRLDAGCSAAQASAAVRLVLLYADIGLPDMDGAALGSVFSPAAVTPAGLGDLFANGALTRPLSLRVEGRAVDPDMAEKPDLLQAILHAARHRPLEAGTIVTCEAGHMRAPLVIGDTLRVEMRDAAGHSIFGAIERELVRRQSDRNAA